jgi:hypothetical protein
MPSEFTSRQLCKPTITYPTDFAWTHDVKAKTLIPVGIPSTVSATLPEILQMSKVFLSIRLVRQKYHGTYFWRLKFFLLFIIDV